MNIVILRGNLTRDPELRTVNSGEKQTSVVSFTVAVSKDFTRANGTKDKIVHMFNVKRGTPEQKLLVSPLRRVIW